MSSLVGEGSLALSSEGSTSVLIHDGDISAFDGIPFEVSILIFSRLSFVDLCSCAMVSKAWKQMAEDETLWQRQCALVWDGKISHPPLFKASPNGPVPLLSLKADFTNCLPSLSSKELRAILARRNVPTDTLLEKQDFFTSVLESTPTMWPRLGISSKWKASFAAEWIDCGRTFITEADLTSYAWKLLFKGSGEVHQGTFDTDHCWRQGPEFPDFPYRFLDSGNPPNRRIQVSRFPEHSAKRDPANWGWILENTLTWMIATPKKTGGDS